LILGKLAAEKNRLKGFSDISKNEIVQISLAEQTEEVEEVLSKLKY
jgi:hypothetical protein